MKSLALITALFTIFSCRVNKFEKEHQLPLHYKRYTTLESTPEDYILPDSTKV